MNNEQLDYSLHYNNWHSKEEKQKEINYFKHLLKDHNFLPDNKDDKVLEIGTGMGRLLISLKDQGYDNVKGCEIDKGLAKHCFKEGLDIYNGDIIEYLKKIKEKFDVIYFFDVLEHLPKDQQIEALSEINKHLSEKGKLILSVPNALAPLSHYFENIDWTHHCSFSPHSLSFVLKSSGLFNFTFRPSHQESLEIRKLKKHWIDLYKAEFNIENPIMTPSIFACAFKQKEDLEKYISETASLMNFSESKKKQSKVKRIMLHIIACFIPFRKIRKQIRNL